MGIIWEKADYLIRLLFIIVLGIACILIVNQQDTFIAFLWLTVCLWASPLSCKQYMNTRIL